MRNRALIDPDNSERLLNAANELERVLNSPEISVPELVGTWAKARRIWCDISGDNLI